MVRRAVKLLLLWIVLVVRLVGTVAIVGHPIIAITVVAAVLWIAVVRAFVEVSASPLVTAVVARRVELALIFELPHAVVVPIVGPLLSLRTLRELLRTLGALWELLRIVRAIILFRILWTIVKILIELRTAIAVKIVIASLLRSFILIVLVSCIRHLRVALTFKPIIRSVLVWAPVVTRIWIIVKLSLRRCASIMLRRMIILSSQISLRLKLRLSSVRSPAFKLFVLTLISLITVMRLLRMICASAVVDLEASVRWQREWVVKSGLIGSEQLLVVSFGL